MAHTRRHSNGANGAGPQLRALDPARKRMQILRTEAGGPPVGLAEGELSIEYTTPPRLWCGAPLSIDSNGRVQVNVAGGSGIPEPTTGPGWLRAMNGSGSWVAGLPLTGGVLSGSLRFGALADMGVGTINAQNYYQNGFPFVAAIVRGTNFGLGVSGVFTALTTGTQNFAFGNNTMSSITWEAGNIAIGNDAMRTATSQGNVAIGQFSLGDGAVGGNNNIAIGRYAMRQATGNAAANIAIGPSALLRINAGQRNIGTGNLAAQNLQTGSSNVVLGDQVMVGVVTGDGNVAVGDNALSGLVAGNKSNNIALGSAAARFLADGTTNSERVYNSIFIGAHVRVGPVDNQANQIVIGYEAAGAGSNTITLGNNDMTAFYTRAGMMIGNPGGIVPPPGGINMGGPLFFQGLSVGMPIGLPRLVQGFTAPASGVMVDIEVDGINWFTNRMIGAAVQIGDGYYTIEAIFGQTITVRRV